MINEFLCGLPWYVKVSAPIAYMFLERWLGKTEKTEAGSVLEWFEMLFTRRKEDAKSV